MLDKEAQTRKDIVLAKESLKEESSKARAKSLGWLALSAFTAYGAAKQGLPSPEQALQVLGSAAGAGFAIANTHKAISTGQEAAALRGAIAQHDLATAHEATTQS